MLSKALKCARVFHVHEPADGLVAPRLLTSPGISSVAVPRFSYIERDDAESVVACRVGTFSASAIACAALASPSSGVRVRGLSQSTPRFVCPARLLRDSTHDDAAAEHDRLPIAVTPFRQRSLKQSAENLRALLARPAAMATCQIHGIRRYSSFASVAERSAVIPNDLRSLQDRLLHRATRLVVVVSR